MVKTREELKTAFRSGAIPTASDFASLIDSLAHVDQLTPISNELAGIETRTNAIEQKVAVPATRSLQADGTWQVLKSDVDSLCAFEVLAQIDQTKTSPFSAVTHAIAVSGATRSHPSVRLTKSYSQSFWPWVLGISIVTGLLGIALLIVVSVRPNTPLAFHIAGGCIILLSCIGILVALVCRDRRAITVAWQSNGHWFDSHRTFNLVVRTGCDYGSKTQKIQMNCQIRRLWN